MITKRGKRDEGVGVVVGVAVMNRTINILVIDLLISAVLTGVALSGNINNGFAINNTVGDGILPVSPESAQFISFIEYLPSIFKSILLYSLPIGSSIDTN